MLNQIRTILSVIIIMALLLGSGLPFGEQPATAADGEGQDLPPLELPEKGNPKLDSQLNQLVSAQTSKRVASFAQESNIELVDGNVRVIVESLPDQVDAAVKTASGLGVVETSYRNLLQVVVPIPQLTALADSASIRLVRLPWYPVPSPISGGHTLFQSPALGAAVLWDEHTIAGSFDGANSVYATDVDGDGDIDVLGAAQNANDITWWENDGSENFTEHTIAGNFDYSNSVYAIDVDGDGDIDVLGAARYADDITWWENDGSENFTEHTIADSFDGANSVYAIDVDGDNDIDVLATATDADDITWWENDGSQNFTEHTIKDEFGDAMSVYATDVDGDGDIDVLGAAQNANDITWWENGGSENFTEHTIKGDFAGAASVYATDVDGDGDIDVLGAAQNAADITWWENDGNENFTEHTIKGDFDGAISVYAIDVDGDSDVDVLGAARTASDITWWENDGSENFTEHTIAGSFNAMSVYATDVDGDGDIDVLGAAVWPNNDITWWENHPPDISEGVELINADEWQTAGYTGAGVKIAILDSGFTGYADLLGTELPSSVTTQSFYAGSDIEGDTAHGTACAEIVYDIAPDADFYLVNFNTDVEMGNAVDWLINTAEVDVISNSVVWPIYGPGDGTGPICEMVDDARAAGILWSISMGNYAQMHWQGDFVDTEPDLWHNFSGVDEGNSINVTDGDRITALLKWDDPWGSSANDYDLYLIDNTSTIVWGSEGTQDGNDDPVEGFSYTATYTGFYSIAIRRYSATETVNFHLFSIRHNLEYQVASGSLAMPADSANAMAVGAVPWNNPTALESFSSQGPTEDNRTKPDLVAPDGVSTATYGATDFYGTSASAPHVAGAAALVKERYPSYTPAQIQAFLEGRAVELGAAGKDNLFGSGRLDLGSILVSIEITPPSPSISAGRTQQFTATGTYSDNSTDNITTTVTWSSDNTSVATIGENTGLAQSLAEGQTTITATSGAISDNTTLTVGPKVLDAINITPDNPTIALGRSQQFTATGTYSDNSTPDITDNVTWSSDNTSVATIGENTGLAQSVAEGQTTITAASGNVSDTTILTVGPKALDAIAVTPPSPSISAGRTQQFTATGTYSDNSTDNLTSSANWSSSNTTVARINAAGLATSYAAGTTVITATSDNVSGNTTLTVDPAVLDSIIVTPVNPAIVFVSGNPPTLQFIATASYSDGETVIVTNTANWTSDNTSVATIGVNTGLAATVADGTTMITATYDGTTGNTTLTVLPDTVPPVVTLTSPTEGQIFSDNTTTVSGYVDDVNATANVTVNGVTTTALTLVNGNFSDNVTLNPDSNTILVTAVDGSGNTGTSGTITVVVDPDKPTITITQPVAGVVTDNSSLSVIGIISGNVTSANVILNGVSQSVNVTAESFSANVTLEEGVNILVVNAYIAGHEDESDYLGTSGVRIVTLDTTAPVVIIDSPVSGHVVSTPGHVVSGTIDDPCVSTANLTLNGASRSIPVVGGTFAQNITLVSGNNTITVTATDEIGNTSPADLVTVIFDNTKPEVTIIVPANNLVTNTANQTVTGTVNDPTINTANLTVNDGTPQPISVSSGSFSANVTLTAGANTLEVTASDSANNTGTSGVVNVTLDNTAPAITIGLSDPTDSIAITVTSNEALAAAPTASVNATVTVMTQIDVNKWSGTYGSTGSPIADGAYTVTANATDKAGNTANRTATFCKQTVTITDNETETVSTGTTTLEIQTTANVTDASISVTQHLDNPSGNVGNPQQAEKAAGAFVEIVVSPELRDNLKQIYIRVDYDRGELPADTDESTLRLYLWDVASGTWQVVPGSGVNTAEDYIYGTVTHLSKYGGFGTVAAPPAPTPPGGGAGGGGGWLPGVTGVLGVTTDKGKFTEDVTCRSEDKKVELFIPEDTIGKNRLGSLLTSISIIAYPIIHPWGESEDPPAPPEQTSIIGLVYGIGPDGANFDPPIDLTIKYDESEIPEGLAEKNIVVAWWDETASQWIELESTVDLENDAVTAKISHFTAFTILAHTRPASFTITDLSVTPGEIDLGESVSISVFTTNNGDLTGSYEVSVKIDNVVAQTKEVTLDGGDSETISFSVTPDTVGERTVNVSGLLGTFKVKAPKAPPAPPPAPAVAPAPASFAISDLSVIPSEVKLAEQVTISAVVTNTGGSEGSYTVVLKINGAEEAKKEVTLGAGKSETVTFTIAKDTEGSYTVNIDGKVGQFTVTVPPPPTPTPVPTPGPNWGLIGGIIAGCLVVVGLLVYFFVWRKRGAPRPP